MNQRHLIKTSYTVGYHLFIVLLSIGFLTTNEVLGGSSSKKSEEYHLFTWQANVYGRCEQKGNDRKKVPRFKAQQKGRLKITDKKWELSAQPVQYKLVEDPIPRPPTKSLHVVLSKLSDGNGYEIIEKEWGKDQVGLLRYQRALPLSLLKEFIAIVQSTPRELESSNAREGPLKATKKSVLYVESGNGPSQCFWKIRNNRLTNVEIIGSGPEVPDKTQKALVQKLQVGELKSPMKFLEEHELGTGSVSHFTNLLWIFRCRYEGQEKAGK